MNKQLVSERWVKNAMIQELTSYAEITSFLSTLFLMIISLEVQGDAINLCILTSLDLVSCDIAVCKVGICQLSSGLSSTKGYWEPATSHVLLQDLEYSTKQVRHVPCPQRSSILVRGTVNIQMNNNTSICHPWKEFKWRMWWRAMNGLLGGQGGTL